MLMTKNTFSIPERHYETLKLLNSLEKGQLDQLVKSLKELDVTYFSIPEDIIQSISESTKIEKNPLDDIISLLQELHFIYYTQYIGENLKKEKFFELFRNAIEEISDKEVIPQSWKDAEEFWRDVLNLTSLEILAKATHFQVEHEKILVDAKVLTDLRPIFAAEPLDKPKAGIITHALKLTFIENFKFKKIDLHIEKSVLEKLNNAITRAKNKESNILKNISIEGFKILQETEDK